MLLLLKCPFLYIKKQTISWLFSFQTEYMNEGLYLVKMLQIAGEKTMGRRCGEVIRVDTDFRLYNLYPLLYNVEGFTHTVKVTHRLRGNTAG